MYLQLQVTSLPAYLIVSLVVTTLLLHSRTDFICMQISSLKFALPEMIALRVWGNFIFLLHLFLVPALAGRCSYIITN